MLGGVRAESALIVFPPLAGAVAPCEANCIDPLGGIRPAGRCVGTISCMCVWLLGEVRRSVRAFNDIDPCTTLLSAAARSAPLRQRLADVHSSSWNARIRRRYRRGGHMTKKFDAAGGSPQFVTVSDLAKYWNVSTRTVYRHILKGALAVVRIGPFGRLRIPLKDAMKYGRGSKEP
jgi:excisionase family DNA binding protein